MADGTMSYFAEIKKRQCLFCKGRAWLHSANNCGPLVGDKTHLKIHLCAACYAVIVRRATMIFRVRCELFAARWPSNISRIIFCRGVSYSCVEDVVTFRKGTVFDKDFLSLLTSTGSHLLSLCILSALCEATIAAMRGLPARHLAQPEVAIREKANGHFAVVRPDGFKSLVSGSFKTYEAARRYLRSELKRRKKPRNAIGRSAKVSLKLQQSGGRT